MNLKRKYSSSPTGSNKKIRSEVKWAEKMHENISFLWQEVPINSRGTFFMLQCLSTYPIIRRKQWNYYMLALTMVLNKTYSCHVYAFLSMIFREACKYFKKCFLSMKIWVNFKCHQVYVYFINILLYTHCFDFNLSAPNLKYIQHALWYSKCHMSYIDGCSDVFFSCSSHSNSSFLQIIWDI